MAELVQALDPGTLLQVEIALSFLTTPFSGGATYNFPLFLFGMYAYENIEAAQSLQTFTTLLGVSALFDVFWMITSQQAALMLMLTIVIFFVKIPMFLSFGAALRQRGRGGFGGLGVGGDNLNGPPIWSMPGGFGSGGDYQSIDEENPPPAPAKSTPPPAAHPVSQPPVQSLSQAPPQQPVAATPNSYQAGQ